MTTFLSVSLYAFAGCAATGMVPAAVLAARSRSLTGLATAALVVAFVMFVLITAAGRLR